MAEVNLEERGVSLSVCIQSSAKRNCLCVLIAVLAQDIAKVLLVLVSASKMFKVSGGGHFSSGDFIPRNG